MKNIEVSFKPAWVSLLYGWIFAGIPIIVVPLRIIGRKYRYDGEKIIVERGIFNTTQLSIQIYRITDIRAYKSVFGYGTILISEKTKTVALKYVKDPLVVTDDLRTNWKNAKTQNNVMHHEVF